MDNVLSQHLQDCFLKLCIHDYKFLRNVRQNVKLEHFSSDLTRKLVSICYDFLDNFNTAPDKHFENLIEDYVVKKAKDDAPLIVKYYDKIVALSNVNTEYVVSKVSEFVKARTFEVASFDFIDMIKSGKLEDARTLMLEALNSGIKSYEKGTEYLEKTVPDYNEKDTILMPTGVEELDMLIRGYKRKQLLCFLGNKKGKKSWKLQYLAKTAMIHRLNVVYITHELSESEVERRLDMSFGSLTDLQVPSPVTFSTFDKAGNLLNKEIIERETTRNKYAVRDLRQKLKGKLGRLFIKKFPMGKCTISDIESYLDYLEVYENFIPDVLINDYIDIMRLPHGNELRNRISEAYIHHKRIADERNILVATVSQTNRAGERKGKLSIKELAEDVQKAAHVDLLIGLVETETEAIDNIMRIWVIANRSGPMDCGAHIHHNLTVGQLVLASWPMNADRNRDNSLEYLED